MLTFALSSPEVVRVRAVQDQDDTSAHVDWRVTYSNERFEFRGHTMIPVIGALHAGGPRGWADVHVAALLAVLGEEPADLESEIAGCDAIETLYDVARGHLASLLTMVDAHEVIPYKSPDAHVSAFTSDPMREDESPVGLTP